MAENSPVLCGSTLFVLLLEAKKTVPASKHFDSITEPTSDYGVLAALVRTLYPTISYSYYEKKTLQRNANEYKKGTKGYCGWLPFDTETIWEESLSNFKKDYKNCLIRTNELIEYCLTDDVSILRKLGKQILELIVADDSIPSDAKLYLNPNNTYIVKNQIKPTMSFCLQSLVLGAWSYIIENKIQATDGAITFEMWHGTAASSNSPRPFVSDIGSNAFKETNVCLLEGNDTNLNFDEDEIPSPIPSSNFINYYDFNNYLVSLKNEHTSIKTFIYAEGTHEFNEFYVCNEVRFRSKERINGSYKQVTLSDITATKLREQCSQYTVLTGSGGLGKSMMMNHLLLSAIESYETDRLVPVFVLLNEFKKETGYLDDFIFQTIKQFAEYITKDQYLSLLKSGTFLFLLDGLDEIESSERSRFEKQINEFTSRYSGNSFIISSRVDSDFGALNKFSVAELVPFSKEKSILMVDKLDYGDDQKLKEEFKKKLKYDLYDKHQDFTSNPLLLTIMLITYEQTSDIPEESHKFYQDAFDALARSHDSHKSGYHREYYTHTSGTRLGDYLTEFCYFSFLSGIKSFEKSEFEESFEYARNQIGKVDETFTCDDFIDDLMYSLCILKMNAGKYYFVHQAFQEYFCAKKLVHIDDVDMHEIGNTFIEDQTFAESQVFTMLYEMNKRKVEKFIFLPYLSNIFANGKNKESFIKFLSVSYDDILFSNGEVDEVKKNKCTNNLLNFISHHVTHQNTCGYVEGLSRIDELVDEAFIPDVTDSYCLQSVDPDIEKDFQVGCNMSISIQYLMEYINSFTNLIDELYDTNNDIAEEFNSLYAYYSRIRSQKDTSGLSLLQKLSRK